MLTNLIILFCNKLLLTATRYNNCSLTLKVRRCKIAGVNMRLSPRSIPGPLSPQNTGALDWGPQGLIAYGTHNSVAVVHVESLQLLQVLAAHNFHVSTVSMLKSFVFVSI